MIKIIITIDGYGMIKKDPLLPQIQFAIQQQTNQTLFVPTCREIRREKR
jgi:hypothetical protein